MKLDTVDWKALMLQAHYLEIASPGRYLYDWRQASALHNQGMVAGRLKRLWQSFVDAKSFVVDAGSLSMHEPLSTHDLTSKDLADTLMPETDPEDRDPAGERPDKLIGNPSVLRATRPR